MTVTMTAYINAVVVRDWTDGNAEDIGESCAWGLSSKLDDILSAATVELGVGGITPIAETLPMNHDW